MRNKGFTLIELMISLFIVTVAIGGAFSILQKVIVSTSLTGSNLIASFLAQEGLEIVRNIRDQNWLESASDWREGFLSCIQPPAGIFCEGGYNSDNLSSGSGDGRFLWIDNQGFYSYNNNGKETKFKRKIYFSSEPDGGNILEVKVVVQWQDRGRNYELSVLEKIYNWYRP